MGAVTVWLENAPYTVVIHLALALGFLALLLLDDRRLFPAARSRPAAPLAAGGSAAHLGLAAAVFGLLARRVLGWVAGPARRLVAAPDRATRA